MSGLSELAFSYESDDRVMAAKYQRHFSDAPIKGLTRSEMNNPILSLAGRAISAGAVQSFGKMSLSARAVSGVITDETLLENDPAVSSDFEALRLGSIMGVESGIGYNMDKVSFSSSVGVVHESNTILGTYTDGLMNMGGGDTTYVDNLISFMPFDDVKFTARATFAQTKGAPTGELITSLSTIDSNAWSLGAEIGQFAFAVSQPLAVQSGNMQYATADYNVVENADGNYELESNPYIANLNLSPEMRETRFSGAYRMHLGPVTTGALGYIYRLHPNHTDEFGNESIFMMKINHKIGI